MNRQSLVSKFNRRVDHAAASIRNLRADEIDFQIVDCLITGPSIEAETCTKQRDYETNRNSYPVFS